MPVRIGQGGRRVAVLDPVVLRLASRRVARQPAWLAQGREVVAPPGDELVDVGLVARVPEDHVAGRVEDTVKSQASARRRRDWSRDARRSS